MLPFVFVGLGACSNLGVRMAETTSSAALFMLLSVKVVSLLCAGAGAGRTAGAAVLGMGLDGDAGLIMRLSRPSDAVNIALQTGQRTF